MNREQIIKELRKYFNIKELVCDHIYAKFGETSWQFLNTELLHTLYVLRCEIFKVGIIINTSSMKQRGLRCNICPLVKSKTDNNQIYVSAHVLGSAFDFDAIGYTAAQSREIIALNASKLPYNVRIENDVTWVHIDVYDTGSKIKCFNG